MKIPRRDPSGAGRRLWRRSARMNLVRPKADFDPETIAVLCAALDETWDRLLQSGSDCTRPAYARAMREVVARRVIDMAQRGITDRKELADGAVRFLAANYRYERKDRQGPPGNCFIALGASRDQGGRPRRNLAGPVTIAGLLELSHR